MEVWPSLSVEPSSRGPLFAPPAEPLFPGDRHQQDRSSKRRQKRTGPKPTERDRVIREMRADIASREQSLQSLRDMLQKELSFKYRVRSRSTALKALQFLQDEADALSSTNSGK
jgi:hypothetical protein